MNDSEINHTHEGLSDQICALQRQNFVLLLALLIVSGTLAAYLWYQSHVMAKTIENVKPQAMQVIQTYKLNQAGISNFVSQITAYGATHPEFQPVLKKYGWNPATANSAPKK